MEEQKKKRNLKELIKKKKRLFIIIACFIIYILFGVVVYIFFNFSSEAWQNYWSVFGAIAGIIGAFIILVFEQDSDKQKEKELEAKEKEKKETEEIKEKIKEREKAFDNLVFKIKEEGSPILIENYHRLESSNIKNDEKIALKKDLVKLFYQYQLLDYLRKEFPDDSEDILDPTRVITEQQYIFQKLYTHDNFIQIRQEIYQEFNFSELEEIFDHAMPTPTIENPVDNEESNDVSTSENDYVILDVKENKKDILVKSIDYPSVLGDWIMNPEKANQVEYLIGISVNTNDIIAIYKLIGDKYEKIGSNRIRFGGNESKIIYNIADSANYFDSFELTEKFKKIFSTWSSRNPILYFNQWCKNNNVDRTILLELLKCIDSQGFNDSKEDNAIVLIKTNQYDKLIDEIKQDNLNTLLVELSETKSKSNIQDYIKKLNQLGLAIYLENDKWTPQKRVSKNEIPIREESTCIKLYCKKKDSIAREYANKYTLDSHLYNIIVPTRILGQVIKDIIRDIEMGKIVAEEGYRAEGTSGVFFERAGNLKAFPFEIK